MLQRERRAAPRLRWTRLSGAPDFRVRYLLRLWGGLLALVLFALSAWVAPAAEARADTHGTGSA